MKSIDELINEEEPALGHVMEWVSKAEVPCEILPPSDRRAEALLETQVSTRSPMGAIVYETGGILIEDGWLRFLGSGHARLSRSLPAWNRGRSDGLLLVADDAAGGFFAINGGALGDDTGAIYYWPPDGLQWEPLELCFTDFFCWCLTSRTKDFYADLRWGTWKEDSRALSGDRCMSFYPFLWTAEGSIEGSSRRDVLVSEAFDLKVNILRQMT